MTTPERPKSQQRGQILEVKTILHYPERVMPIAVTWTGLSKLGQDIQIDLGSININEVATQVEAGTTPESVNVTVGFSGYLTPTAFLKLHADLNRIYELMKKDGVIK